MAPSVRGRWTELPSLWDGAGRHASLVCMSIGARWAIVAPLSVGLGTLFTWLHVPAAWILAAILVSGTMAITTGEELPVNHHFYAVSRGFIGMMAAVPLTVVPVSQILGYLPAGIVIGLVTVLVGAAGGVLLHRTQPKDVTWETGILSMLPGGASMMPALANELGADYRYVALTQYLRLLAVSVTLPAVVAFLDTPAGPGGDLSVDGETTWWIVVLTIAIAVLGEYVGKFLRLPAAAVLGPLLLTVIAAALLPDEHSLQPLYVFKIMAFLSIGWVCGGGLSLPAMKSFAKQLPVTIVCIVVVILACAATAWPLTYVLDITYFEGYLATSPGALETVLALSAEGGAGPAVVALQLIRLILVLVVAGYLPQILRFLARFRRKH